MDADIISYETLIATRDSAQWVMWGAIATGVAAAGSILTLICAAAALSTWKKQEKTKIKSEFKKSLLALDYSVHMMPDDWNFLMAQRISMVNKSSPTYPNDDNASISLNELKKCWHNAISAWVMCEGQLKKTNLPKQWHELSGIYIDFIQGKVKKIIILDKLAEMHSIEFIFD